MKILVTGCAGFIGSHLCERLLDNEYIVFGIDNLNNYYDNKQKFYNINIILKHKNSNNFKFIREDISKTKLIDEIRPEIVIHLAGLAGVRYSIDNPTKYSDTNITSSIHLLEKCVKNNVKKFIFASSSSVYGSSSSRLFSENNILSDFESHYALSKYCLELYAKLTNKLYGLNTIGLRFFTVYGPRGRPDMAPYKFLLNILNNKEIIKYGDGFSSRDYTYIDDIIDGIMCCLKKNKTNNYEVYNLGNNKTITLNNFIEICEKICNKKALIKQIDNQVGDVPYTCADLDLSKKELNYNPKVDLETGLTKLKEWLIEYKNISI